MSEKAIGVTEVDSGLQKKRERHFDIARYRDNFAIEVPVVDGIISDWDSMEKIWEHAMANYLKSDNKDTPVLFSEKPHNTPKNRQR